MALDIIEPRPLSWMKRRFKETDKNYSTSTRYYVKYDGEAVVTLSKWDFYDNVKLASYNIETGEFIFNDLYTTSFPLNREGNVEDFSYLLYYITTLANKISLFSTNERVERRLQILRDMIENKGYSEGIARLMHKSSLVRNIMGYTYRDSIINQYFPNSLCRELFLNSFTSIRTTACSDEVLYKIGYRMHTESNSWWYLDHWENGRLIPWENYIREEECSECHTLVRAGNLVHGICPSCLSVPAEKLRIHNYTTRVPSLISPKIGKITPKKLGKSLANYYEKYWGSTSERYSYDESSPLMLGIELEYEATDKDAAMVKTLMNLHEHAILKSDGSLTHGFEIVTCPATLDVHLEAMKPFFDNFPRELKAKDTCGIHVHVSRKPLGLSTQGKLIAFMNNPYNKDFLVKIGRRYNARFAYVDPDAKMTDVLSGAGPRYRMLNNQNDATLEFRLFRSTKDWQEFVEDLESVISIVDYCKPCSSKVGLSTHSQYENYLSWLSDNRKSYPNIHKYLTA